ncbi:MAG: 3-dehydroquinate synthase [Sulfuricurvum sp.]|uniref:3-dehydroquinate synthase n=1 Tax=Sulfuricurvum sp. TaxID=2025608 RepID=UPI00261122CA|nr:3-dehydroquinate synthase [Sulfuricurvum sp.]MDD2830277.1 3-dehydroquinate synthase [Sulfuricurvum sp.]MDD4949480.1 3-dehydroquinate synthase [Sulfuricurvum sp.]
MTLNITLNRTIDDSYPIHIGPLSLIEFNGKVAILTNPKIAGLHLQTLLGQLRAKEVYIITIPDGEQYKNWESIEFILDRMFDHRLNRKSLLIAFGGGVIGDMGGFASSLYNRGIDFIQIPTTLLSQVDASVGGKTGINNKYGKNLIGAFHQPRAVHIDPSFLSTLPSREFGAGVAEIVKMAVTFNRDFFEWLENNNLQHGDNLITAITKAVETKARVVEEDEKEQGLRAALNYGHTFGHVIENETKYETYLHGECVAIGMVMANELAVVSGLMNSDEAMRVKNLLAKYDLPLSYTIVDVEKFYQAFFLDKKSADSAITFILPRGIGDVEITDSIEPAIVKKVLSTFSAIDGGLF